MLLTIMEEMIRQDLLFQEGLKRRKKEGIRIGKEEGKKEDIQKLYLKGRFFPEEIANLLKVPLEFVKRTIAEVEKERS